MDIDCYIPEEASRDLLITSIAQGSSLQTELCTFGTKIVANRNLNSIRILQTELCIWNINGSNLKSKYYQVRGLAGPEASRPAGSHECSFKAAKF